LNYFRRFAEAVDEARGELATCVRTLKANGNRLAAYGAAAKGAALLNYAGIDGTTIDYVVDRSPHKQGMLMPGTHIPIRDPAALVTDRPDVVLLLAWNIEDEVIAQQQEYLRLGGAFLVPGSPPRTIRLEGKR
jgi:hypothetical protein